MAAGKLTREEFDSLKAGLQLPKLREEPGLEKPASEAGTSASCSLDLGKTERPEQRKLKNNSSDEISLNDFAFPCMFDRSPAVAKALPAPRKQKPWRSPAVAKAVPPPGTRRFGKARVCFEEKAR